jgi:hypothetical protein
VRDEFRLARGWWEAKDTSDNLAAEIGKKLKAGYPTREIVDYMCIVCGVSREVIPNRNASGL